MGNEYGFNVNVGGDAIGKLKQINDKINDTKASTDKLGKSTNDTFGKAKGKILEMASAFSIGNLAAQAVDKTIGFVGGAFDNLINSTEDLSDKYRIVMAGMESATKAFYKSIATGDIKNLIENMSEARERGERHEGTQDLIDKTGKALEWLESAEKTALQDKFEQMKGIGKYEELSYDKRYAAAVEYETKTKALYSSKTELAKKSLDNELDALNIFSKKQSDESDKD